MIYILDSLSFLGKKFEKHLQFLCFWFWRLPPAAAACGSFVWVATPIVYKAAGCTCTITTSINEFGCVMTSPATHKGTNVAVIMGGEVLIFIALMIIAHTTDQIHTWHLWRRLPPQQEKSTVDKGRPVWKFVWNLKLVHSTIICSKTSNHKEKNLTVLRLMV